MEKKRERTEKKSINEKFHVEKNSYNLNRQKNIHTSYEEETTCTPGKPKKKKKITRRVELTSLHLSLVFSNGRFLRRNL